MNIKIVKNKYLNTLFLLMFFSAVIHMVFMFCIALKEKSIYPLNIFHILNLDILFPQLFNNTASVNLASIIFLASVYSLLLFLWEKRKF